MVAAAPAVLPTAWLWASTEPSPEANESPAYSSTTTPRSAGEVAWAVMAGLVPPPFVIGAVQMLISVLSAAANEVTLV